MNRHTLWLTLALLSFWLGTSNAQEMPTPAEVLGFEVGADYHLADYGQIEDYFERLAATSDKVKLQRFGKTTEGRDLLLAFISAPENLTRLDELVDINRQLASGVMSPDQARAAALRGRTMVVVGGSVHASEVGGAQMSMELAYQLASGKEAKSDLILSETVLALIPCLNPDGLEVEAAWYRENLESPTEGGGTAELYHKYVGHDINRDYFMLNLSETRAMNRLFYQEIFPQVFLTMHQMGTYGPRMFVPPHYDPPNPDVHPILLRQNSLLGQAMASALEDEAKSGVVTQALFDEYFAGYEDSAPMFHNVVSLLSEVASVRRATPLFIRKDELQAARSPGLTDLGKSIRHPNPWPGGWWRLADIVEYDRVAVVGLLEASALYREKLMVNVSRMASDAIRAGESSPPFAYVVPRNQHDPAASERMIEALLGAGIQVHRTLSASTLDGMDVPAGSHVISTAQPYRPFIRALLERQSYPERRLYPDGPPERPYDVTAWSMPLQMGVEVVRANTPLTDLGSELEPIESLSAEAKEVSAGSAGWMLPPSSNASYRAINRMLDQGVSLSRATRSSPNIPAGAFLIPRGTRLPANVNATYQPVDRSPSSSEPLRRARIGLYRPWGGLIDEGWTRWLLEDYGFPYQSIRPERLRNGGLSEQIDVLILPALDRERLVDGRQELPELYRDGIGNEGVQALRKFIERGGRLVAFDSGAATVAQLLALPVENLAETWDDDAFFCPGALMQFQVERSHPLSYGMPDEAVLFFGYSPVFKPLEEQDNRVQVLARYPQTSAEGLVASGWALGEEKLAGLPAALEVALGEGRVFLFGFRPQHRGQTHATFKMVFNALLMK